MPQLAIYPQPTAIEVHGFVIEEIPLNSACLGVLGVLICAENGFPFAVKLESSCVDQPPMGLRRMT